VPVAGAGALLAAAGLGAAASALEVVARDPPGVSNCGKVARCAAAGSVGRKSGPRCPQAAKPPAVAARQTMSAARLGALT